MDEKKILLTLAFIVVGGAVAKLYCELVRRSVAGIGSETAGMGYFLALMLVRVGLIAATFIAAAWLGVWARVGVWPLVGNISGFFVVRTSILVRTRRKNVDRPRDKKADSERE